jgi:nucleotide-binding universal stress UspA family protein
MEKNQDKPLKKKDFKRIIAAIDGSSHSKLVAEKAIDFARDTGIEMTALYVIHEPTDTFPEFEGTFPDAIEVLKAEGRSFLDDVKKMGSKMGVDIKLKLAEGHPDKEIIKEARKDDLIVMGCKEQSALSDLFIGSVCEKVLHHSNSSIMLIR